jgi:hypothetical protein
MCSLGSHSRGAQFRLVSGRTYFKKRNGEQVLPITVTARAIGSGIEGSSPPRTHLPLGERGTIPDAGNTMRRLVVPRAASRRIRVRGENCNRLSAAGHSRLKLVEPFHLLDLQSAKRLPPPMTRDLAHVDLAGPRGLPCETGTFSLATISSSFVASSAYRSSLRTSWARLCLYPTQSGIQRRPTAKFSTTENSRIGKAPGAPTR